MLSCRKQRCGRCSSRVVDRTFNCMSIDTDTSTSDTVVLMANGLAGKVKLAQFEKGLVASVRVSHQGNRAQRRRRHQTDHRGRQRRQDDDASKTRGEVSRQFAAGENGRLRLRPQLGPGDHGRRQKLRSEHRSGKSDHPFRRDECFQKRLTGRLRSGSFAEVFRPTRSLHRRRSRHRQSIGASLGLRSY